MSPLSRRVVGAIVKSTFKRFAAKTTFFAASLASGVAIATVPALSDDARVRAPHAAAMPAAAYDWTGAYIGVNLGYGVGRNETSSSLGGTL